VGAGGRPKRRKRRPLWDVPPVSGGPVTISGYRRALAECGEPGVRQSASGWRRSASPRSCSLAGTMRGARVGCLLPGGRALQRPDLLAIQRGGRRLSSSAKSSPQHRAAPRTPSPARRYLTADEPTALPASNRSRRPTLLDRRRPTALPRFKPSPSPRPTEPAPGARARRYPAPTPALAHGEPHIRLFSTPNAGGGRTITAWLVENP
jgi:hypothetical protein